MGNTWLRNILHKFSSYPTTSPFNFLIKHWHMLNLINMVEKLHTALTQTQTSKLPNCYYITKLKINVNILYYET